MMTKIPRLDNKGYRSFAFTTGSAFVVIFGGLVPWVFDFPYPVWPWLLFFFLAVWGLVAPRTLMPVYVGWMTLALLINRITTPIILGVVFYLFLSPMAIVIKVLKKDPIPKGFDKSKDSYRLDSEKTDHENLERPF